MGEREKEGEGEREKEEGREGEMLFGPGKYWYPSLIFLWLSTEAYPSVQHVKGASFFNGPPKYINVISKYSYKPEYFEENPNVRLG